MKKIKNLLIVLLLIFGFVSCKPSNKVSSSVPTTPISQTSSETTYKVALNHLKCSVPNEIKRKQQFRANSLDYQYLVVDINNDEIILSIYLNNEKDYHIFDFELECNDENAKVFIDNEFKLINSLKSINWKGDTNTRYDIKLKLTKSLLDVELNIKNIYYSDRANGENVYTVDLNNKGTYNIYKVNKDSFNVTFNEYKEKMFNFNIDKIEDDRITDIKIVSDGKELEFKNQLTLSKYYFDIKYKINISETLVLDYVYRFDMKLNSTDNEYFRFSTGRDDGGYFIKISENKLNYNTTYHIEVINKVKNISIYDDYVLSTQENMKYYIGWEDFMNRNYNIIISFDDFVFDLDKLLEGTNVF